MPTSPPVSADGNLLFGVLALRHDFVSRDALIAGMDAWATDNSRPLGRILCEQGALPPDRLQLLDALVIEHINRHDGDATASLAAFTPNTIRSNGSGGVTDPAGRSTLSDRGAPLVPPASREGARYTNLRFHRRGGLGQVFLADDTELKREVALKQIQPHRADDPSSQARFVREAEITGALEHPGVIPVYGLGTYADGRPYYAMRFVRGESLKDAIDRYHKAPEPPELRRLIARLIDVCNAIAYAHSRGVVHRDLKPQNVMLGPFGETLVVDWGLAKAGVGRAPGAADADVTTDPSVRPSESDHGQTQTGSSLGTPGYMSPEQAAGRHDVVGPASDVFGLGAILYCLLTGRKPFEGTAVLDEITQTKKGQYSPPRQVNAAAPAALDAICRKALAHEPANRYPSALALAADLERWLADDPVDVYRDPPAVRALRWARRHRSGVAAGVALILTAIVGLSLGSALLWREERRTRTEFDRAEREHQTAEHNFETVRATVLEMGRQIEEIETGASDPQKSDRKRKAALDAARKEFEHFVAENPNDRVLKKQLAALHRFAANVSRLLGDFPEAEKAYQASIALWEELAAADPDDATYCDNLAQTLFDQSTVQKRAGHLRDALKTLGRSAALVEEIKDHIPPAFYQRTLASALLNRSDVEFRLGDFAAAEKSAARAVELYDVLKDAPPGQANPIDAILAAIAVRDRGAALREMGRIPEALKVLDDAVARTDALAGPNAGRDVRHNSHRNQLERATTRVRTETGAADALRELNTVIEGADKLVADFPQAPMYKEVVAEALVRRGELTAKTASEKALADFDRALLITRELIDKHGQQPDHIGLRGEAYIGKGQLLVAEGKQSAAGECFDRAVKVFEIALKLDPDNVQLRRDLDRARPLAKANPR
jgi:serine/threonine-protein kinase